MCGLARGQVAITRGRALEFAPLALRADRSVVLAALAHAEGSALAFAADQTLFSAGRGGRIAAWDFYK